jgi:hypothetical protein
MNSLPVTRQFKSDVLRAALRAQGFMLLKSVFDSSLMIDLRESLDRARLEEEKKFGLSALEEIGQDGYVSDLLAIGIAVENLLDGDAIHQVLSALMDDEARLYIGQGIILDPGKGRGIWPRCWHADMYQERLAIGNPTFCYGVNCIVIVDDIIIENGPTGVLVGSHGLKELYTEAEDDLKKSEFRAVAPSGSLLVLDAGVWHSANMNTTDEPRRIIKLLFTRSWIRPQINYSATTNLATVARLSQRARRLLGLSLNTSTKSFEGDS